MNDKKYSLRKLARLCGLSLFLFLLSNVPVRAAGEPDLTITKTHTGTFTPLETGKTYTITVSNIGASPSTGTVTVVDTLPSGLSATDISGGGWSCTLATLTCTRSDALNESNSYPDITVTVDVLVGATDPQTNQAVVSGGGEVDTSNNTALDPTTVNAKSDLIVTGYELRDSTNTSVITAPNPDESFFVRMTIENRGGTASGNFYPGVFLDDKPNYGPDHDEVGPPLLTLGEITDFEGYEITPSGAVSGVGCMYYDPTNSIDPMSTAVFTERGNYTRWDILPALPAGTTTTVDVEIAYPIAQYPDPIYDADNVRAGLKTGSYRIYLYADPNCSGGDEESVENNNSFGPINLAVGTGSVYPSGAGDIEVNIGGTLQGQYVIAEKDYRLQSYPGLYGGPVLVDNHNDTATVASIRLLYLNTFGQNTLSELMGVPTSQLLDDYWMPVYLDDSVMDSQIRFTNTSTTQSTTVQVYIGGVLRGTYTLAPRSAERIRYQGLSGGPVRIVGTPGVPILAGMRIIYSGGNSFDEIMAYPTVQLDDEYWFPFYNHNNVNLDTELRIANTSSSQSSTVNVYFGATLMGTYNLGPTSYQLISYPGQFGGPVHIVGTNGVPLVASLRLLYLSQFGYNTMSELMGVATANLLDSYAMPVYLDDSVMDSQVRFTNTSTTQSTTIQVFLGSALQGTYTLGPSSAERIRFLGVSGGPVRIVGTPGVPILAGMRIIYGGGISFDEIMAYPLAQLHAEYWFPFYNHNLVNLDTEVRFATP